MKDLMKRRGESPNRFLAIVLSLFLTYFLICCGILLIRYGYVGWFFSYREWMLSLLLAAGGVWIAIVLYQRLVDSPNTLVILTIFALAMIPRVFLALWYTYVPVSDFKNYYQLGLYFHSGQFSEIAKIAEGYGISAFTGLSVLNGLIAAISTSVQGFQTVQACMTSLIAVQLFLIGKQIDRRVGILSGLAFAIYPCNLFFSQVLTNQHWSILIGLTGVWCLLAAVRSEKPYRWILFAGLTGLLTGIGQFAHPSTQPVIIAYSLFLTVLLIRNLKRREHWKRPLICLGVFLAALLCTNRGAYKLLEEADLYHPAKYDGSILMSKVLFGTNPDTLGAISYEDSANLQKVPEEERVHYFLKVLFNRIKDVKGFSIAQMKKMLLMWATKDNAFDCYLHGLYIYGLDRAYGNEPYDNKGLSYERLHNFTKEMSFMDFLFVGCIYLFALIGALSMRRRHDAPLYELCLWICLGWIGVHQFIEIQSRYRYYAMPYLILLAAMGAVYIIDLGKNKRSKMQPNSALKPEDVNNEAALNAGE